MKITSEYLMERFGQDMCDGCSIEGVMLHSYHGSLLCDDCCEEQDEDDDIKEVMNEV